MFDGCDRLLKNVRYVLDIRRNLISLDVLDSLGYKARIENGYMKIAKGSMTIMKGKLSNGLYTLLGETVIRTTTVMSKSKNDKTDLRYKRLGHVSAKGLQELYK